MNSINLHVLYHARNFCITVICLFTAYCSCLLSVYYTTRYCVPDFLPIWSAGRRVGKSKQENQTLSDFTMQCVLLWMRFRELAWRHRVTSLVALQEAAERSLDFRERIVRKQSWIFLKTLALAPVVRSGIPDFGTLRRQQVGIAITNKAASHAELELCDVTSGWPSNCSKMRPWPECITTMEIMNKATVLVAV